MTLELEIDVPDSRQVTFTLPPDTPVGPARVTVRSQPSAGEVREFNVVLPEPPPPPPAADKFEREQAAFHRLLPDLLTTHRGQYVAIHDGQVIAVGNSSVGVLTAAEKTHPGTLPLDCFVTDQPQPPERLPSIRAVRAGR